jgi:hypothetical protein
MNDQPKINAIQEMIGEVCVVTMNSGRRYTAIVAIVEKHTILIRNEQGRFLILTRASIESISPKGLELEPIGRAYQ